MDPSLPPGPPPLTLHEALSGISGLTSIASWLFLLLPQLYENYTNQHADGISLAFLLVWFCGDIANLSGALWGALLPTVIAIGIYFCIIDAALIGQTVYYRVRNARRKKQQQQGEEAGLAPDGSSAEVHQGNGGVSDDERSPLLLGRSRSHDSGTTGDLPYTRRRRSSAASTGSADYLHPHDGHHHHSHHHSHQHEHPSPKNGHGHMPSIAEQSPKGASVRVWVVNLAALLGVIALGTGAWALAWKLGWWVPQRETLSWEDEAGRNSEGENGVGKAAVGAEVLGYISSVLYLGARLPQIWKNWREKSCDGLSLLFFMLSTLGNLTFGTQILFHSVKAHYVIKNLPWLIGSLGTIVEDIVIFIQFHIYAKKDPDGPDDVEQEEEDTEV